jgi:hypothetical protein
MSKEPIKKANGSLAVSNFEQDANMGMGNLTQDDLALPFLKILGQLSPEVSSSQLQVTFSMVRRV